MRRTFGFWLHVNHAHVHDALQAEFRAQCGGRHAVHARACFGDDASFGHSPRQQDLSEHVVDLVGAGVIEVLAFEIDLCAGEVLGHAFGEIERRRPADIMLEVVVELGLESQRLSWLRHRQLPDRG